MSHEKKVGVGAHSEEEAHPARESGHGESGGPAGVKPESDNLINRYALEKARYQLGRKKLMRK